MNISILKPKIFFCSLNTIDIYLNSFSRTTKEFFYENIIPGFLSKILWLIGLIQYMLLYHIAKAITLLGSLLYSQKW